MRGWLTQLLAGMLVAQALTGCAAVRQRLGQAGVMARFSRDDELQADRLAVRYLAATGYDPNGLVSLFKVLAVQEAGSRTPLELFLASHPETQDRIRRIETAIAKSGTTSGDRGKERFQRGTASLRR
ncbi:MAG: M48 family metallopeptidase [Candidatus Latescibacterota bacterium]|jgi:predicted Zn-dependent protease